MATKVVLRSGKDRMRYTLVFEALLMCMLIPAGALFFDRGLLEIGLLGAVLSLKAMAVNVAYNWAFDHVDAHYGRVSSDRSHVGRFLHAIGFEGSLTLTSLPIYTYWLNVTWLDALAMDIVVTTFVVVFTYVYTMGYDRMFPVQKTVAC